MSYFLKTEKNTDFSDTIIPAIDQNSSTWTKVYFGKFKEKPITWRVIEKRSEYFHNGFFLDCDEVLEETQFYWCSKSFYWTNSFLCGRLNNTFAEGFTETELDAVGPCQVIKSNLTQSKDGPQFDNLYSERFFVLDASELPGKITDSKYLKKEASTGTYKPYWLRSYSPEQDGEKLGAVIKPNIRPNRTSAILGYVNKEKACGVSPACNIDPASIFFSTRVARNTYKFTITDRFDAMIEVPSGSKVKIKDGVVTVPYSTKCYRAGYNAVSILILGKKYEYKGKDNDTSFRYYEILKTPENYTRSGTVSFTLPRRHDAREWGERYHVYLLIEELHSENETDYVGLPYEIKPIEIEGNSFTIRYYLSADDTEPYLTKEYLIGTNPYAPSKPTMDGYIFNGWKDRNGKDYKFDAPLRYDVSLYASWTKKPDPPKEIPYNIWVGDVQITSINAGDVLGDGKVIYDQKAKTLTFNNANIKKYTSVNFAVTYMLRTDEDLTILGKVKLEAPNAGGGIYVNKGAALNINAEISISAKTYGIFGFNAKEIKVSGGKLGITGASYGILAGGEAPITTVLNISGGSLEVESQTCGISAIKKGKIIIAETLRIHEPRRPDFAEVNLSGTKLLALVDEYGNAANLIIIAPDSGENHIIADFELEDGLEYNSRRYEHIYTTKAIEPKVFVRIGRKNPVILREGVDYKVTYKNNEDVSEKDSPAVATITYRGKYKGKEKLPFYILPKPIGNGQDSMPSEGIFLSDVIAVKDGDFSITMFYNGHRINRKYLDLVADEKKLLLTIKGKGNYSESIKDVKYKLISQAEADNTKIKAHIAFTYDGKPKVLSPDQLSVKDGNGNPIAADKFFVQYEDNINVGLAKAHIIAKNGSGYYGESVIYFDILPKKK